MKECRKCGSEDLVTTHIPDGAVITSSSLEKVENDFITSMEYDYFFKLKAKKEHLKLHCRNCQFSWRENTKDAAS
jgi:predicted nucleic-acid-binding Zn-ribbon protein